MILLYDPDCGFCTRAARWLERRGLAAEIAPMSPALLVGHGVDVERAQREVPYVDETGVRYGAEAVAAVLRTGRGPWRLVGRVLSLPGVRGLAAAGYAVVARHRHQLPGGTAACRLADPGMNDQIHTP